MTSFHSDVRVVRVGWAGDHFRSYCYMLQIVSIASYTHIHYIGVSSTSGNWNLQYKNKTNFKEKIWFYLREYYKIIHHILIIGETFINKGWVQIFSRLGWSLGHSGRVFQLFKCASVRRVVMSIIFENNRFHMRFGIYQNYWKTEKLVLRKKTIFLKHPKMKTNILLVFI